MNGETTKYYKSEKMGSGKLTIPVRIARMLGWEHQDEIHIELKTKNGIMGLFIYKPEKRNNR